MSATAPVRHVYSVSEIGELLRGLLEDSLPSVWVQGELSNFRNPSGHWYFTLKDEQSQLRCAMFRGQNYLVRPVPKNGDAVLLRGRLTFYPRGGDAQMVVEHLEPAGQGALLRAFEELKKKLGAEGLFDEARKRPLPAAPRGIGIISSSSGAALQDILSTLRRRYPLGCAYLWPVPVQGDAACPAMVRALRELPQRAPVDVIILARGGGSLEDLWCFNHEALARAIRACPVPVVTGIGHETDFTIADFAADLRAPTPTAAAERVAPSVTEWSDRLERQQRLLHRVFEQRRRDGADALHRLQARLENVHPGRRLERLAQRLDELSERVAHCGVTALRRRAERLSELKARLEHAQPARRLLPLRERLAVASERLGRAVMDRLRGTQERLRTQELLLGHLNPRAILGRGYAIARTPDGSVVGDARGVPVGAAVEVVLGHGALETRVTAVKPDG